MNARLLQNILVWLGNNGVNLQSELIAMYSFHFPKGNKDFVVIKRSNKDIANLRYDLDFNIIGKAA